MDLDIFNHGFFFVYYPAASGGSHLSNLITLDKGFYPKGYDDHNEYYDALTSLYSNDNVMPFVAHLPLHHMFEGVDEVCNYIKNINHKLFNKSTHLAHGPCLRTNPLFNCLLNKKIIVLTFFEQATMEMIGHREQQFSKANFINDVNDIIQREVRYLYSRQSLMAEFNIKDEDIFELEASRLYNDNIIPVIDEINLLFDLNIPTVDSQHLHELWLKNLVKI